jgi:DNA-binding Lrp family transcriptional regulator
MDEKIQTLHPQGKQGVNINKDKYDVIKAAIINVLQKQGEMTFNGLNDEVSRQLEGNFAGSIGWYVTTVKLDLEARGVIERFGKSPQQLRLIAK